MTYTTELSARTYDDKLGLYIEVREDGDSLGLCEIAYSNGQKGSTETVIVTDWEMALKVASSIQTLAELRKTANPEQEKS